MSRTLDQILADVTARSDPQRKTILDQIAALPNQQTADEAGIEAKKNQSFDDIRTAANRRGMAYSGVPIDEQARYLGSDYTPALANLKSTYGQRQGSLESALAGIGSNDFATANDIYNQDRSFEEQQRQFNENLAESRRQSSASNGALAGLYGSQAPTTAAGAIGSGAALRVPGDASRGFAFTDNKNNVINALQYSQGHQVPFRTLLQQMAAAGDAGAKAGLLFIGNDGNADPTKVTSPALADLYYSLTGRRVGIYQPPQANKPAFGLAPTNLRSSADPLGILR